MCMCVCICVAVCRHCHGMHAEVRDSLSPLCGFPGLNSGHLSCMISVPLPSHHPQNFTNCLHMKGLWAISSGSQWKRSAQEDEAPQRMYDLCTDGLPSSWCKVEVRYDSQSSLPGLVAQALLVALPAGRRESCCAVFSPSWWNGHGVFCLSRSASSQSWLWEDSVTSSGFLVIRLKRILQWCPMSFLVEMAHPTLAVLQDSQCLLYKQGRPRSQRH